MEEQLAQRQSTIALYYPWVRFRDDNWLKLALLTWDNIARIRPSAIGAADNELVRQIRSETDLIVDITPSRADLGAVSDAFDEVLSNDRLRYDFEVPDDLRATELVSFARPPTDPLAQTGGGGGVRAARDGLIWVYAGDDDRGHGKMNSRAQGVLGAFELAVRDRDGGPWLGMRPKVASGYLTVLADAVARHNRLCPVTDDPRAHVASGTLDRVAQMVFGEHAEARHAEQPESAYLHLALSATITPERLTHLPISKIIAFRRRYAAELGAFRQHVASLAPELGLVAQTENLQVAHAHLQAIYDRTTKPQLDELRRGLRGLGIESAVGTLGLKVDLGAAASTLVGAAAAADGHLAVAGAAVGIAVLPYLANRANGARQLRRASPVAYLLAADRKLARSALPRRR